jgi:hypothetical protein
MKQDNFFYFLKKEQAKRVRKDLKNNFTLNMLFFEDFYYRITCERGVAQFG